MRKYRAFKYKVSDDAITVTFPMRKHYEVKNTPQNLKNIEELYEYQKFAQGAMNELRMRLALSRIGSLALFCFLAASPAMVYALVKLVMSSLVALLLTIAYTISVMTEIQAIGKRTFSQKIFQKNDFPTLDDAIEEFEKLLPKLNQIEEQVKLSNSEVEQVKLSNSEKKQIVTTPKMTKQSEKTLVKKRKTKRKTKTENS